MTPPFKMINSPEIWFLTILRDHMSNDLSKMNQLIKYWQTKSIESRQCMSIWVGKGILSWTIEMFMTSMSLSRDTQLSALIFLHIINLIGISSNLKQIKSILISANKFPQKEAQLEFWNITTVIMGALLVSTTKWLRKNQTINLLNFSKLSTITEKFHLVWINCTENQIFA